MADLHLVNLGKTQAGKTILSGINLEIAAGELIVFVGPSGCGKTTLLRMIAGLEPISTGDLFIDGQRANDIPPARRGVAMVFQSYALYPHMTARDNIAFALKVAGHDRQVIDQTVKSVAEALRLTDCLDRYPASLSGGQRQRVAIARAMVRDPRIFLFDEPLSNLDAALRVNTRLEIARLKRELPDRTMIYVTHDQVEAMTLASRIVVLAEGGIAQVGTPLELYSRPRTEFVARFIGSPAMNLWPGTVVATGEITTVRLDTGALAQAAIPTRAADLGLRVTLGIRPEDLTPTPEGLFTGTVEFVEALGEVTLLHFRAAPGEGQVVAKLPGINATPPGTSLTLTAAHDRVHLFHAGQSLLYR